MSNAARTITEVARCQFDSSFVMLERLVDLCPDDVWAARYNDLPFWYHAYHVAYFIDYWLREEGGGFPLMAFDGRIPPEFEHDVGPELIIPRADLRQYLRLIRAKTERVFGALDDEKLVLPVVEEGQARLTHADVIIGQVRHIMYNIGYLNGILRSMGLEESDWYAYNEPEE